MARQAGIIKLTGSVGGVTFYMRKDGTYFARKTPGISKKTFKTSKNFEGSRRAGQEFGQASRVSSRLRRKILPLMFEMDKGYLPSRMTAHFQKVLRTDPTHGPGERKISFGNLDLMKGFRFGTEVLKDILGGVPHLHFDEFQKSYTVDFSEMGTTVAVPKAASHSQIRIAMVGLEEDGLAEFILLAENIPYLPVGIETGHLGKVEFHPEEKLHAGQLVFMIVGIRFFQEVNGEMNALRESEAFGLEDCFLAS
ncbi:hypothetical protein P872_12670 [Rhodonellum psychrophilum GCM71 = DSM 17998]|uniref:Uncharacterized protein n=2 Tax=Rhodonellum TaxID=336827 RepID=U5BVJ0_9BACT|nr:MULTISPECIES: hypothetical protein [Rhodonellum]ERM80621.1 hypothetical protein P872_12670 [Rhodonellum psychrophilum GCM71 = DSM 17998]SDZ55125.1 hypothetical protein SAMN05444412_12318 [Rhodonellum ikkaensis]